VNRKLKTRVLEMLKDKRKRGESVDPLTKEGYSEGEVVTAVEQLKEEGLILDNLSLQWWKEDRLTGPGAHVIDEIDEERDSKLYWNMLMEDHRRGYEAGR